MSGSSTSYRKYILFFIFAWLVINFFPGSYSIDTWYQYYAMANKNYDDWHSPWLAFLWKLLFIATHKFFALYLFQMAWYFIFYYYLLKRVTNKLTLGIGLFSSVFFVFIPQYLMKDVHLALAWGSAALILLYPSDGQPKPARYLALLLVAYGLFLRPNTLPALLPFLYIYTERYSASPWPGWRKALMALGLGLFMFCSYYLLTYFVFQTRRAYPEYKLKLLDVIGITKLSGQNYMPECITTFSGYNQARILEMYTPATVDHIYWQDADTRMIPMPTKKLDQCLTGAWKKSILEHPYLYLKNRAEGFLYFLKIWTRPVHYDNVTVYVHEHSGVYIDDQHTPVTNKLLAFWNKLDAVHFYDPWLWLLLNTVFFVLFVVKYLRHKIDVFKTLAAVQLSGILFTLGMFPVYQIDTEFRYSYWNVFALLLSLIYYFGVVVKPSKQPEPL